MVLPSPLPTIPMPVRVWMFAVDSEGKSRADVIFEGPYSPEALTVWDTTQNGIIPFMQSAGLIKGFASAVIAPVHWDPSQPYTGK